MKKLIFGIAALFMMSVVLVGCDNKKSKKDKDEEDVASVDLSPEEEVVECLEDMVSLLKRTHIESEDDVEVFADKARKIKSRVDSLIKRFGNGIGEDLPEDEKDELIKKLAELSKVGEEEAERLQKEAAAAGIDLTELDDLDIF